MSEYEFDVLCQNINITIFSKSDGNLQFKKQGILQDIHRFKWYVGDSSLSCCMISHYQLFAMYYNNAATPLLLLVLYNHYNRWHTIMKELCFAAAVMK